MRREEKKRRRRLARLPRPPDAQRLCAPGRRSPSDVVRFEVEPRAEVGAGAAADEERCATTVGRRIATTGDVRRVYQHHQIRWRDGFM
jgi:hypothetical protein